MPTEFVVLGMRGPLQLALASAIILAGCTAGGGPHSAATNAAGRLSDPIVVALIDSGANPYQPIFRGSSSLPIEGMPDVLTLDISLGLHPDEGRDADRDVWGAFELRRLYAINGTRLLVISFRDDGKEQPIDYAAHGAGTSYIVARDAPDVVIVMVQVRAGSCIFDEKNCSSDPTEMDPSVAEAMAWVADQPWIDVVSVSIGTHGSGPDPGLLHPEATRFLEASRRATDAGKILVFAAGNAPTPPASSHFAGVPWSIAVGGYEPSSHGQQTILGTATGFDVLANYTEYIGNFHEMGTFSGTSFAAPGIAATLAEAWHLVRAAGGGATSHDLRDALNASAILLGPSGWDPTKPSNRTGGQEYINAISAPFLLPTQQGWGYVNASLAPEIARRVLEQDYGIPADKGAVALYQERYQAAREQYWSNPP